jgi:predicted HTH domain antitoxin
MANPLKPTPILEGEDKERFWKDFVNVNYSEEKEIFLKQCSEILSQIKLEI